MRCELARQAISAELDGEQLPIDPEQAEAHVAGCNACRRWRELAQVATRRTRVGGALPPADLTGRVIAAVREDARRRRARKYWLALARAVICAGMLQTLATVPLLILARSSGAGHGRVHLLDLVEVVIGAGFFLGALAVLWQDRDSAVLEVVRTVRAIAPTSSTSTAEAAEVA